MPPVGARPFKSYPIGDRQSPEGTFSRGRYTGCGARLASKSRTLRNDTIIHAFSMIAIGFLRIFEIYLPMYTKPRVSRLWVVLICLL